MTILYTFVDAYTILVDVCLSLSLSLFSIYLVTSGWRLIRVSGSVLTLSDASLPLTS